MSKIIFLLIIISFVYANECEYKFGCTEEPDSSQLILSFANIYNIWNIKYQSSNIKIYDCNTNPPEIIYVFNNPNQIEYVINPDSKILLYIGLTRYLPFTSCPDSISVKIKGNETKNIIGTKYVDTRWISDIFTAFVLILIMVILSFLTLVGISKCREVRSRRHTRNYV